MGALFSKGFDPSTDLLDLTGKVAIVTGGNTGMGQSTVKYLARRGAKVYLAARNESKAIGAITELEHEGLGGGSVVWLKLDLLDPQSVKAAADEVLAKEKRLDILVNNAALVIHPYHKTNEGIQEIIMANVIGAAIFIQALLPLLKSTAIEPNADVRIVNVSSNAHTFTKNVSFGVNDLDQEFASSMMPAMMRYGYSKLAFLMYTQELQKRLDAAGIPIIATSPHPGMTNTSKNHEDIRDFHMQWIVGFFGATPDKGSHTILFAAASPKVRAEASRYKVRGVYLVPVGKLNAPSADAQKPELQAQLWATVQRIIKEVGVDVKEV